MRLIDSVLSFDHAGQSILCRALPTAGCPFVRNGAIPGIVSLEYMAQTVAAYVTLRRVFQAPSAIVKPRVGYIISARNLSLRVAEFELDQPIVIRAKLTWSDNATASFDCSLERSDQLAASTQLSVYEPPGARGAA